MKILRKSTRVSSSSDDAPLVFKKNNNLGGSKSRYIMDDGWLLNCDICDETFDNRYQVLVHNASHIIIPLWKQTFYQCPECRFHYQSLELLNQHISTKHLHETRIVLNKGLGCHKTVETVRNRIKFVNESDMGDIKEESQINIKEDKKGDSKNRIVFEEFDEDIITPNSYLLDDITNYCEVNLELLPPELVNEEYNSVHYDVLVAPGIYNCKVCYRRFTNRFQLIQHETKHIQIKKDKQYLCPFCNKYIAGGNWGLRNHKKEKHKDEECDTDVVAKTCVTCGLKYYNYYKHIKLYHKIYVCRVCGWRFDSEEKRQRHVDQDHSIDSLAKSKVDTLTKNNIETITKSTEKTHKLCDICLMLDIKNKPNFQVIGEKCVLGEQQICTKCNSKCFEVKVVKYNQFSQPRDKRKKWEVDKKPLSNKDRLKNIQHRFKLISKMNKF